VAGGSRGRDPSLVWRRQLTQGLEHAGLRERRIAGTRSLPCMAASTNPGFSNTLGFVNGGSRGRDPSLAWRRRLTQGLATRWAPRTTDRGDAIPPGFSAGFEDENEDEATCDAREKDSLMKPNSVVCVSTATHVETNPFRHEDFISYSCTGSVFG
jgi:hypothetical protein